MENKIYKPLIGKMFYVISIPTALLLIAVTITAVYTPALLIMIPTDLLTLYFIISPLFGKVTLTEEGIVVKFGFFATRIVPYSHIRSLEKVRKWYSDSTMSLKNSMEHVNIKYNRFDIVSVSVTDNDGFIAEVNSRIKKQ